MKKSTLLVLSIMSLGLAALAIHLLLGIEKGNTALSGEISRPTSPPTGWHYIAQTDTTFLKIAVSGSPGNWLISDVSPFKPASGYEPKYLINDVVVRGSALKNYNYQSNYVLDIKKHIIKIGSPDDMGTWTREGWAGSDPNAGQTFGPRSDVGGQTIIMFDADDTKPGLAWLDRTPDWYQGERVVSWPYRAPNMRLPAGKYIAFNLTVDGVTQEQRQARGEVFTQNHTDITKSTGVVAGSNYMGITNPNGDREYFRRIANKWPLYGIQSFEYNEGNNSIPTRSNQERWILERLRERYREAGRTDYILMPNYGGYDFVGGPWPSRFNSVTTKDIKWRYTGTRQELLQKDTYLNFYDGVANGITLKHYGTEPTNYRSQMLRIAQYESIKKAGYKAILFGWGKIEFGITGWVPGFGWQANVPSGGVGMSSGWAVVPFDDAVANGFMSLWWGDGFWIWDDIGTRNRNPATLNRDVNQTFYKGARLTPGTRGHYPWTPDVAIDGYYIGAYLYNQCSATEGGKTYYATYTLDGTTYPAEPDGSDALSAYDQSRGLCSVRTKDGKATIVYYNPSATNTWQTFSVKVNGKPFTGQVYGKRIYVVNVSI